MLTVISYFYLFIYLFMVVVGFDLGVLHLLD
jgi:hypothetical protein